MGTILLQHRYSQFGPVKRNGAQGDDPHVGFRGKKRSNQANKALCVWIAWFVRGSEFPLLFLSCLFFFFGDPNRGGCRGWVNPPCCITFANNVGHVAWCGNSKGNGVLICKHRGNPRGMLPRNQEAGKKKEKKIKQKRVNPGTSGMVFRKVCMTCLLCTLYNC